jgi:acyl-CoA synthetase (AMP-forming)/AMP-acid ligase II
MRECLPFERCTFTNASQTSHSRFILRSILLPRHLTLSVDAHYGVLAARAILTPINTRLKPQEVAYILEHSGSRLILVDHEYTHLIQGMNIPTIVSEDTGRPEDPYETFLSNGRIFSREMGWAGLDAEPDENAGCVLCYTYVLCLTVLPQFIVPRSGTTGRVCH